MWLGERPHDAMLKFSASTSHQGLRRVRAQAVDAIGRLAASLLAQRGANLLSLPACMARSDVLPASCKLLMCKVVAATITIGSSTCIAKNRLSVHPPTTKAPHAKMVRSMAISANMLVITVAPHSDIWPHGSV